MAIRQHLAAQTDQIIYTVCMATMRKIRSLHSVIQDSYRNRPSSTLLNVATILFNLHNTLFEYASRRNLKAIADLQTRQYRSNH